MRKPFVPAKLQPWIAFAIVAIASTAMCVSMSKAESGLLNSMAVSLTMFMASITMGFAHKFLGAWLRLPVSQHALVQPKVKPLVMMLSAPVPAALVGIVLLFI